MPSKQYLFEVSSNTSEILVSGSNSPIAAEIISQLKDNTSLSIVSSSSCPQVIIHLLDKPTKLLHTTLAYTTRLFELLELARTSNSKIIIVLLSGAGEHQKVALDLIGKYKKNFNVSCSICEYHPGEEIASFATDVIKKFIHGFQPKPKPKLKIQKKRSSGIFNYLLVILGLFLVPWATFAVQLLLLFPLLFCSTSSLQKFNYRQTKTCSGLTLKLTNFLKGQTSYSFGLELISLKLGYPIQTILDSVHNLAESVSGLNEISYQLTLNFDHFINSKKPRSPINLDSLSQQTSLTLEALSRTQANLKILYLSSGSKNPKLISISNKITYLKQLVSKISQNISELPVLLSSNKTTKYLIVFQDNFELRPSGGVIDSVYLITAENGRIVSESLVKTDVADKQLLGRVEPPLDFKIHTGRSDWTLRDSNWDVEFTNSAKKISWFVSKELNQSVDFVITANLSFYPSLLTLLGPLNLPEGKRVTAKNFAATYFADLKSGSGNSDFISSTSSSLWEKIKEGSESKKAAILAKVLSQLESGNIAIAPLTLRVSSVSKVGWDQAVPSFPCPKTESCEHFIAASIDSNVGGNKSNYFITKKEKVALTFTESHLLSNYTVSYTNTGPDNTWPFGSYRNYLRIIIPPGFTVSDLKINGISKPKGDYEIEPRQTFSLVKLVIDTPNSSSTEVLLESSKPLSQATSLSFNATILGQPGSSASPSSISINYPLSWFVSSTGNVSVASPGRLEYNSILSGPVNLNLDIFIPTK